MLVVFPPIFVAGTIINDYNLCNFVASLKKIY